MAVVEVGEDGGAGVLRLDLGDAVGGIIGVQRLGGVAVVLASDAPAVVQRQHGGFGARVGGARQAVRCVEHVAPGAGAGEGHSRAPVGVVEGSASDARAVGHADLPRTSVAHRFIVNPPGSVFPQQVLNLRPIA